MFRLTHFCLAVVLLCVLWTSTESRTIDAKDLLKKLVAEKNKKAEILKERERQEKENKVKEAIALLKKKTIEEKAKRFDITSRDNLAVEAGIDVINGDKQLEEILSDAQAQGGDKKTTKKSYYEVWSNLEFILTTLKNFGRAPCTTGLVALNEILGNDTLTAMAGLGDEDENVIGLTVIEWWGENKCTEFFEYVSAFNMYLWSIFWDDLAETACYQYLPKDGDGTINWNALYEWTDNGTQAVECKFASAMGALYFKSFFKVYHGALPDALLEEIFNDFGVNDYWHPHLGLHYSGKK